MPLPSQPLQAGDGSRPPARGRFAPTPSGPLHAGSVLAAIGSYLSVKAIGGEWYLRMEDLDRPRQKPGAAATIQRQLERLALEWDDAVLWQSEHRERYRAALDSLIAAGAAFPCGCSRAALQQNAGHCPCRERLPVAARAWRLRPMEMATAVWEDRWRGPQIPPALRPPPALLRADGIVAYVLAAVVDDGFQGISEVVRGEDLLPLTGVQRQLQTHLGLPHPSYAHLPLLRDERGRKLSKSAGAPACDTPPEQAWEASLRYLGWDLPKTLQGADARTLRDWALQCLREGAPLWPRAPKARTSSTGPREGDSPFQK
ncbi:tRNA glutamyl-Q(34) synthetase GluQRS [Acidithiobacillus sp.]|uniref:tRNA glutamyl-Q(34) synthetase GluQRS n=1 Tax=Acidithiobacillus sp. TaxID=1872118 RepID=UPI0025C09AE0|nr:tRNA glutamyl-Q(34) synthetase GluQRS [Acidithiobacillus sp.]